MIETKIISDFEGSASWAIRNLMMFTYRYTQTPGKEPMHYSYFINERFWKKFQKHELDETNTITKRRAA